MRSRVTLGELTVMLNNEELTLVPNHRAFSQISRQYGGLQKARQELVAENVDAVVFILRLGTKMNDKDAKDLMERVYTNGITAELLVALIKYVAVLGNSGKPLDEDEEEEESPRPRSFSDDEGNA